MAALTKRYDKALAYASRKHRHQLRKGTKIPYISHLLSVSALVLEHGGDEDQAIAALLHDAVEDQGGRPTHDEIEQLFGERVARIVRDCTDAWTDPKPEWCARKKRFLAGLPGKSDESLLVMIADKVHNARTIRDEYARIGDDIWARFKGGRKDGTIWYYNELVRIFSTIRPGKMTDDLAGYVAEFSAGSPGSPAPC